MRVKKGDKVDHKITQIHNNNNTLKVHSFFITPLDLNINDIANVYEIYSQEEIDNFKCIFEMFDKEGSGFIDHTDLQTIMRSLGRDPQEAHDLIGNFQSEIASASKVA